MTGLIERNFSEIEKKQDYLRKVDSMFGWSRSVMYTNVTSTIG